VCEYRSLGFSSAVSQARSETSKYLIQLTDFGASSRDEKFQFSWNFFSPLTFVVERQKGKKNGSATENGASKVASNFVKVYRWGSCVA
jgi:hypothetical protein